MKTQRNNAEDKDKGIIVIFIWPRTKTYSSFPTRRPPAISRRQDEICSLAKQQERFLQFTRYKNARRIVFLAVGIGYACPLGGGTTVMANGTWSRPTTGGVNFHQVQSQSLRYVYFCKGRDWRRPVFLVLFNFLTFFRRGGFFRNKV